MLAASGCGKGGPAQYAIHGQITYKGEPVPSGLIRFQPDKEAGNDWKSRATPILNGKYTLSSSNGVIGGPYEVIVFGHDGVPIEGSEGTNTMGTPLFDAYQQKVELPQSSTTLDIEVPAE
ncbi:hypothetical protein [Calycomorphotria hydatis]|nr:hypothetical protein [Calycomorphotria hydatis]